MKVKTSSILFFIFGLIALCNVHFFYLGFDLDKSILAGLCVLSVLFCFSLCKTAMGRMSRDLRFVYIWGLVLIICFAVVFLYTLNTFTDQNLRNTIQVSYPYLIILTIYPLGCYLMQTDKPETIFKFMEILSVIWYVLLLAQKVLYELGGVNILTGIYGEDGFSVRNGNIRIGLISCGGIMILYNFYMFYIKNSEKKIFYILMFALGCYELIAIDQSRMYIISIFVGILFMVLFDRNTESRFLRKLLIIIVAAVIVYQTGVLSNLFESFSESGEYGGSTTWRLYAIEYYWNYFLKHPFCGMGFVSDGYYYSTVHGSLGRAFMSDVGVFGQLARWGILIIPVYIIPVIRMVFITVKLARKRAEGYLLYVSFLIYTIVTSGSLIMLDKYRILLYPILIILFEYKYYLMKTEDWDVGEAEHDTEYKAEYD